MDPNVLVEIRFSSKRNMVLGLGSVPTVGGMPLKAIFNESEGCDVPDGLNPEERVL